MSDYTPEHLANLRALADAVGTEVTINVPRFIFKDENGNVLTRVTSNLGPGELLPLVITENEAIAAGLIGHPNVTVARIKK